MISIGAAALPSAGLINYIAGSIVIYFSTRNLLFLVMATIGIPLERAIPILSPILRFIILFQIFVFNLSYSVDWFEDRIMTIVNVEGDVFAAATINHHTKDNL